MLPLKVQWEDSSLSDLASGGSWCPLACGSITSIFASIFPWPPFLCVVSSFYKMPVIGFRAHPKSGMISSLDP